MGVGAPSGTVTFLFTDIEGSTRLRQAAPDEMRQSLERHDSILRGAIDGHGGYVFSTGGDGFGVAFARAGDAVAAALQAQLVLEAEPWPEGAPLKVRMGLHTGEVAERDGDYFGTAVNRAARLMAVAHGGQVVCSSATAGVIDAGVTLVDLGDHRLRDLDRPVRVFQVGGGSFAPLRSLDALPGNLPRQLSSFVGRDREMAKVVATLAEAPVVTLTGVGGVGKTRLAVQAAAAVLPRYRDGAWLAELAPVRDGEQVAEAVLGAFSLTANPGTAPADALVDFLRHKQLVLVLDNCEHLIGPVVELVSMLVESCRGVAILATSREGLAVDGERVIPVPSLGAPRPDAPAEAVGASESVRLFLDRAVAVDPDFAVTPANAGAVATICRRLDGIPLAVELAAARIPSMTPAELAGRLDRRFQVLAGGRRGSVERHQTLRAAIDWSFELLSVAQQQLLTRLAVFAGGCTADAVEAVCAADSIAADEVWDVLGGLVARSLVVADHDGAVTRYRLLETIRQYAEDRLAAEEIEALRARHAEHYAELADAFDDHIYGPEQLAWSKRVTDENDNLVAAMNWAVDTDNADLALRIGANILSGAQVGRGVVINIEPALGLKGAADHPLYAVAMAKSAHEAAQTGDRDSVHHRCAVALDIERRRGNPSRGRVETWVHAAQYIVEETLGCFDAAATLALSGAEIDRANGLPAHAAFGFLTAATYSAGITEPATVIDTAQRAVAAARQSGMPTAIALSSQVLASALADSDPTRARAIFAEALQGMDRLGYEQSIELTSGCIVAARLGDGRLILQLARRAIPLQHWQGRPPYVVGLLNLVGFVLVDNRPGTTAVLRGAARSIARNWAVLPNSAASTPTSPRAGFLNDLRQETTRRLAECLSEEELRRLQADVQEVPRASGLTWTHAPTGLDGNSPPE